MAMMSNPSAKRLVDQINSFSQNKIQCREDFELLVTVAMENERMPLLEELSFLSKFLTRSLSIMRRIGTSGDGYDKLSREFEDNIVKAKKILTDLLEKAPQIEKQIFTNAYLTMNPDSMHALLRLFSDLSWFKNYSIDRKREARPL